MKMEERVRDIKDRQRAGERDNEREREGERGGGGEKKREGTGESAPLVSPAKKPCLN